MSEEVSPGWFAPAGRHRSSCCARSTFHPRFRRGSGRRPAAAAAVQAAGIDREFDPALMDGIAYSSRAESLMPRVFHKPSPTNAIDAEKWPYCGQLAPVNDRHATAERAGCDGAADKRGPGHFFPDPVRGRLVRAFFSNRAPGATGPWAWPNRPKKEHPTTTAGRIRPEPDVGDHVFRDPHASVAATHRMVMNPGAARVSPGAVFAAAARG